MNRPAWVAKPKFLILAIGLPVLILGGVSSALIVTNSENQSETTEVEATSTSASTTSTTAVAVVAEELGWAISISEGSRNEFDRCFSGRIPKSEKAALRADYGYLNSIDRKYYQIIMECYDKIRQTNPEIANYNYSISNPPVTCLLPGSLIGMTPNEVRGNISQFRDLNGAGVPCVRLTFAIFNECAPSDPNNQKIISERPALEWGNGSGKTPWGVAVHSVSVECPLPPITEPVLGPSPEPTPEPITEPPG